MARPTSKPRVPTLDPEHESLTFVRGLLAQLRAGLLKQLAPVATISPDPVPDDQIQRTPLYRAVLRVAKYAVHGTPPARPLASLLATLEPILHSPLPPPRDLAALLATINPDEETHAIKLLIAAAVARNQITENTTPVTSSQLAILAGITRRHVGAAIRAGQLRAESQGRPGTDGAALVRPSEAQRWLNTRGIAGYTP